MCVCGRQREREECGDNKSKREQAYIYQTYQKTFIFSGRKNSYEESDIEVM